MKTTRKKFQCFSINVYRLQCCLAHDLCPLEDKDKNTDKDKDKYKYDNMSTRPDQTRPEFNLTDLILELAF